MCGIYEAVNIVYAESYIHVSGLKCVLSFKDVMYLCLMPFGVVAYRVNSIFQSWRDMQKFRSSNSCAVQVHACVTRTYDSQNARILMIAVVCMAMVGWVCLQAKQLGSTPNFRGSTAPIFRRSGLDAMYTICSGDSGVNEVLPYELRERIVQRQASALTWEPAFVLHPEVGCLMRSKPIEDFINDNFDQSAVLALAHIHEVSSSASPQPLERCASKATLFIDLAVADCYSSGSAERLGCIHQQGVTAGVVTLQLTFAPPACFHLPTQQSDFIEPALLVSGALFPQDYWRLHLYTLAAAADGPSSCGFVVEPKHPYTLRQFSVEEAYKQKLHALQASTKRRSGIQLADAFAYVLTEEAPPESLPNVVFFPLQQRTRTSLFGYLEYHFTYLQQYSQLHIPECHSGDELFLPLGGLFKLTHLTPNGAITTSNPSTSNPNISKVGLATREFVAAGNLRDRVLFAPGSYDGQCVPHVGTALSTGGSLHFVARWASRKATSCAMTTNDASCLNADSSVARFGSKPLFSELALGGRPFLTHTGNVASMEVRKVVVTGIFDIITGPFQECLVLVMEGTAQARLSNNEKDITMGQWTSTYLLPSSSLEIRSGGTTTLVVIKLQGYEE
jgi:hypothetical protein